MIRVGMDYYDIPLGDSKLENYCFLKEYDELNSFNEGISANINPNLDGYHLSQHIASTIILNVLFLADEFNVRLLYDVILYNIECPINVKKIGEKLHINNIEYQLDRLHSIVHQLHLDYYRKLNNITIYNDCTNK